MTPQRFSLTLLVLAAFLMPAAPVLAQTTWNVPGDFATIQSAHDDPAVLDGDTLNLAAGTFVENLVLTKDLTLHGAGQGITILDGGNTDTVVIVQSGATVNLNDLTITDGNGPSGFGGGLTNRGGTVSLTRCTVSHNTAAAGGGIRTDGGTMTLTSSMLTHNTATGSGGGGIVNVFGIVRLVSSTVSDNRAQGLPGIGAGIWMHFGQSLTLVGTTVTRNTANGSSGIHESTFPATTPATVTLIDSHVDGNQNVQQGNAVLSGADTLTIMNSTVDDNFGDGIRGGVRLGITSSSVSRNTERGITATGSFALTDSTVNGNGTAFPGVGIFHSGLSSATITRSTISNNGGRGIDSSSSGGMTIENSTVSGNTQRLCCGGGGIAVRTSTTSLDLRSVTVTSNSMVAGEFHDALGGGSFNIAAAPVTLVNTIVAGNTVVVPGTVVNPRVAQGFDCFGAITSLGHNLVGDTADCGITAAAGDIFGPAAVLLDPVLADNGGRTRTHALLEGSPAVDAGDASVCPLTDQREVSRDATCDIGAFELVPPVTDTDGDGILDDVDVCPSSNLAPTIVIDGCDSGVPNLLGPDGCTVADLIAELARGATSHGDFTSGVAHLTRDLMKAGRITGNQKGAIQSCAGQANIP